MKTLIFFLLFCSVAFGQSKSVTQTKNGGTGASLMTKKGDVLIGDSVNRFKVVHADTGYLHMNADSTVSWQTPSSGGGGTNPVLPGGFQLAVKLPLDSAQIVHLNAAPVIIVPAPGIDTVIIPLSCYIVVHKGIAYNNSGILDGFLNLNYGITDDAQISGFWFADGRVFGSVDSTVGAVTIMHMDMNVHGSQPETDTIVAHKPLYFQITGTQEVSDGNATADVFLVYIKQYIGD